MVGVVGSSPIAPTNPAMIRTLLVSGWTAFSHAREERLLDDAIDDTFPASDPVALNQPGSLVSMRYAAREHQARTTRRRHADRAAALLLTGAAIVVTLWVVRRRSRNAVH